MASNGDSGLQKQNEVEPLPSTSVAPSLEKEGPSSSPASPSPEAAMALPSPPIPANGENGSANLPSVDEILDEAFRVAELEAQREMNRLRKHIKRQRKKYLQFIQRFRQRQSG